MDYDEYPRDGVTIESLSLLKPAFKKDGTVTAGNSSGINDGAACVVLMSESKIKEFGINPLAEYIWSSCWCRSENNGDGCRLCCKKVLEKVNLNTSSVDLFEVNEAFAAQSIASSRIAGYDKCMEKVNVN